MQLEARLRGWQTKGLLTPEQCDELLRDANSDTGGSLSTLRTVDTVFVLLSGLLNGAVVLAFAWLYDVDVAAHVLVLLWMASLAPLVYALRLPALGALFALQVLVWAPLFTFRHLGFEHFALRLSTAPVLVLLAGVAVFSFGALHYGWLPFHALARALRLTGLLACVVALLALGSPWVASDSGGVVGLDSPSALGQYAAAVIGLGICGAVLTVLAMALKPFLARTTRLEGPISLGLVAVGAIHYLAPLPGLVFSVLFTALMGAMLLVLLSVGVQRSDRAALTLSCGGLWGLVLLRYVDFGWSRLTLAPFLGVGLALALAVGGGLALVRARALRRMPVQAPSPVSGGSP